MPRGGVTVSSDDYSTSEERNPTSEDLEGLPRRRGRETGALSTEEVVRVASARFIRLSTGGSYEQQSLPLGLLHPSLTSDEVRNVELACRLIEAAEKVGDRQFDRANCLLRQCFLLSSPRGTPVQRVVYHFSRALEERIVRQTGVLSEGLKDDHQDVAVVDAKLSEQTVHMVAYLGLPFTQAVQAISVQAILDHMAAAKSIHVVDLSIKQGLQWRILMQALATRHACPVARLKITAVGASSEALAPTGNSLSSFAEVLGLPFKFRTVVVRDLRDLRADMFDREEGESVGVLAHLALGGLIAQPERMDRVMRVLRRLDPRVVAVMDVEAKLNSSSFVGRFAEALFFYSAYFDCLHELMGGCDVNRTMVEGLLTKGIRSVLAAEGKERVIRRVGIEVWRLFFARYGLVEVEQSSAMQARSVMDQFDRGRSSTLLERDGKSFLVGWKGTPFHFVSAWKFQ